MKKIIALIFVSLIGFGLTAQEKEEVSILPLKKSPHNIGLHAGSTTGLGFSYRYWPGKLGFQVTSIPIFQSGGGHFISVGASALYTLKDNNKVDLYSYFGNHLLNIKNEYNYIDQFGNTVSNSSTSTNYNIGFGIGFKVDFLQSLDFNFQGGYGIYDITNGPIGMFASEIGLYYHL